MKNNSFLFHRELGISGILLFLLALFFDPLGWMPPAAVTLLVLGLIVAFVIYSIFIWRETTRDEREDLHRLTAGRAGFFGGTAMLVLAIVVQSLNHTLDPWLLVALSGMVLAKIAGRMYSELKN